MSALVSVVVTNWNGLPHLAACLPRLVAQTYSPFEMLVVDNGSTDGSQGWLAEHFGQVRLIANPENVGFAAANNQGIRAARGAYIALLNNDTLPEPNWLAALVAALEQHPRLGMAASKMVYIDRPEMINSTGVCLDRCGITWDRATGQLDDAADQQTVEVFGASAGAGLYRRELFDEVGLLDDEFSFYLEDVDLAWRAQWHGWKGVYVPAAKVYHAHSASMHEGSPRKTYHLARNKIWLLAKNYPQPYLALFLPLIVFYEILSLGFSAIRGVGGSAARGRLAGIAALPKVLRQRRALRSTACVPAREVFARLEPAAWPWQVYARYKHLRAKTSA
jgi:GT2 family glycosyltransferase